MVKNKAPSLKERLIASSIGGVITAVVMTPLDVLKVQVQSTYSISQPEPCSLYCNANIEKFCGINYFKSKPSSDSHSLCYQNSLRCTSSFRGYQTCVFHNGLFEFEKENFKGIMNRLIKNNGVKSLWSGLSPTLAMSLPQTVMYYSINDFLKEKLEFDMHQNNSNLLISSITGGISRSISVFAMSPIELFRTNRQTVSQGSVDLLYSICSMIRKNGITVIWRGVCPTLLRDVPYSMIFWTVFDYSKYLMESDMLAVQSSNLSFSKIFSCGAVAGFVSGIITHPFDVVKTIQQIEVGAATLNSHSSYEAVKMLYKNHGLEGIFAGFTPRIVKTTFASALMISTFESLKHSLKYQPSSVRASDVTN